MVAFGKLRQEDFGDPIISTFVAEDNTPWYKKPNLRTLYLLLILACNEFQSGFDSQIINFVQIVYTWNRYFGSPTGKTVNGLPSYVVEPSLKGFLGASYSLGGILALPAIPWINQRVGRRWTIFTGSVLTLVGAILQGFSNGLPMYIIARMLVGFGVAFGIVTGSALLGELGYPKERAVLTSLFNGSFYIGSIIAASVGLGTVSLTTDWAWRIPSLLQMAPSLLTIVTIFFVPESPRYLISKDRHDEAFEILVKYHVEGDRDSLFVKAEMAQIQTTIKLEIEAASQSWWDMFKTAGMRRRLFIIGFFGIFIQWSGNSLISYYLSDLLDLVGITESVVKSKINIGLSCWGLVCAAFFGVISPRFKRRTMYLTCACCLLSVYVAWTISMERYIDTKTQASAILTILFIFLYTPAFNMGYSALAFTYIVEIFPYFVRTRGIAWYQFFARASGFFATYVNPVGLANITWKWLLVYCCCLVFEIGFIYLFFPETYGRTLEELAFMFEGTDKTEIVTIAVKNEIYAKDVPLKEKVSLEAGKRTEEDITNQIDK